MFELKESKKIKLLDVDAQIYKHSKFNTQHIHLDADNDEKVFMVAFRTIPEDSTGVAHILEHTSLCGSKKYPVRDPFFMMIRRSLNSFMNAFTSSDWTAYPFATQNNKDFNNLLDVYVDSAFFPRLDPLDFSQENRLKLQFFRQFAKTCGGFSSIKFYKREHSTKVMGTHPISKCPAHTLRR